MESDRRKASVTRLAILAGMFAATMLPSAAVEAKRAAPASVAPVVAKGVRYTVPHFGVLHGKTQNERAEEFETDLVSGHVRAIAGLAPGREIPAEPAR